MSKPVRWKSAWLAAVVVFWCMAAKGVKEPQGVEQLIQQGVERQQSGRPRDAEKLFTDAMRRIEGNGLRDDRSLQTWGTCIVYLGRLYQEEGNLPKTLALYKRVVSVGEKALGAEHLFLASLLDLQVIVLQKMGNYQDAHLAATRARAIRAPYIRREEAQTHAARCRENLRTLHASLEAFKTEHNGQYPQTLQELVPKHLKDLPQCPAAGKDTYTESYQPDPTKKHYSVFCAGQFHGEAGLKPNSPRYDSGKGILE